MKMNWKKFWKEFNEWFDRDNRISPDVPWDSQKRKIQELIIKYLNVKSR